MPRIHNDPNLDICLDYDNLSFANIRAQLVNNNTTKEQAIQLLRNIWQANNDTDKAQWQQQLEEDRERRNHLQRLNDKEQDRLDQERVDEEESVHKEERKKNKHKYIPILSTGIPNDLSITPCSYAIRKIDKGEYMELWYFTNDGLDEAHAKKTIDDDAMIMSKMADSSTAWVSSASTCNTCSVMDDQNISFENSCQACPCFITAMEEADWPEDRVRMMVIFWNNTQIHKYWSLRDLLAQKTLLVYQAEQRR
ncbi:uncharacterized protein EDB91DRAFT_1085183 [Suillus paluster]|uniref:uncharacterized protein n=1 Tax=Suillus paluster TaxID=48578 RepID=UPI001B885E0E|nr:uncharacterized protein EDB91DRAFT_1085183 [Suillus paluster]KAG1731059.1 hypothetical protein EDB91DRAFT_1085183 [Suillus paluster]